MTNVIALSTAAPKAEKKWFAVTDTAKLIRKALKEAFPEVTFSVRTSKYAGGSSIDVAWTDGPHSDLVKPIAGAFQGGYFDGMTDYKGGREHRFNGELVHFGGDFVFCNRSISKDVTDRAVAMLSPLDKDALEQMAFRFNVFQHFNKDYDNAERLAWLILHNAPTQQFEGRKSATAAGVSLVREY